jgi:hypothetical protein
MFNILDFCVKLQSADEIYFQMQRIEVKASEHMKAKLSRLHDGSETTLPSSLSKQSNPLNKEDEKDDQIQGEERDHKASEREIEPGLKVCKACGKISERMLKCPTCKTQFNLKWYAFR